MQPEPLPHSAGVETSRPVLGSQEPLPLGIESLMGSLVGGNVTRNPRFQMNWRPKSLRIAVKPNLLRLHPYKLGAKLGSPDSFGAGNPKWELGRWPYAKSSQPVLLYQCLRSSKAYSIDATTSPVGYDEGIGTFRLLGWSRKTTSWRMDSSKLGMGPTGRTVRGQAPYPRSPHTLPPGYLVRVS